MDFDIALSKLERDQSKLRKQAIQTKTSKERSKRLAKKRQQEYELKKQQQEKEKLKLHKIETYMTQCETGLLKRKLICGKEFIYLNSVRIEGDEDKIKLPLSILESVVNNGDDNAIMSSTSPLMFRLGIPNENYKFPASKELKTMMEEENDDDDDVEMEDNLEAYRSELTYRYKTYTHAGVMEFTMDEGLIGLPPSIATRLSIPEKAEKPIQVEVSRVTLPKGTECTVIPTKQAIQNGFYGLKDVQAVLEQSIVRTRTTLSIGDTLHGWHRGAQFDLEVQSLLPSVFGAVSCIDTDITLHINSPNEPTTQKEPSSPKLTPSLNSTGNIFVPTSPKQSSSQPQQKQMGSPMQIDKILPEEPPLDQIQNICTIQIRSREGHIKRRFDITKSKISDLFTFVSTSLSLDEQYNLVTRFPRTVYDRNDERVLIDAGFVQGQLLLMVEIIS